MILASKVPEHLVDFPCKAGDCGRSCFPLDKEFGCDDCGIFTQNLASLLIIVSRKTLGEKALNIVTPLLYVRLLAGERRAPGFEHKEMHVHILQIFSGVFFHLYGVGDDGDVEDEKFDRLCCSRIGVLFVGIRCDSLPLAKAEACQYQTMHGDIRLQTSEDDGTGERHDERRF